LSHIQILLNGMERIGFISFTEAVQSLSGMRTASGFRLHLPALITFLPPSASQSPLMLENLRAVFIADGVEIGNANYMPILRTTVREQPIGFTWDWPISALAVYEQIRNGREASFQVRVSGDIRFVLAGQPGREPCSIASTFHEQGDVRYSKEVWTNTMRQLNLLDAVLVEIPFPSDPPNGWEPIWQALRDARNSFDAGGATGWKNCVASVRHALEEWQGLEKEDQGPGWQRPATADLQRRTKEQRIDNIRWHLIQVAHYAAHTKADEWTRHDALLALSTLSALIAVRKP
jgi:hypothetical protein